MRSKVRNLLLAATAAAALVAAVGPAGAAPAAKWDKPVFVGKGARETSLAFDPRDDRNMLICDPSGVPAVQNGQSYFFASSDSGRTWKPVDVENAVGDARKGTFEGGDCDVAYDAGGVAYVADTWVGGLSVGSSLDGGKTWTGSPVSVLGSVIDRPWLVGGPKRGTVFLSYHDLQCCTPGAMWFTSSTDYGKTWATPSLVTSGDADGAYTWEGNFVVGPNGRDVYLVYTRRQSGAVTVGGSKATIMLATSHDAGKTWTHTVVAKNSQDTATIYPAVGLDGGGWLHVVWSQPREDLTDVLYTTSKGGRTWTRPRRLNTRGTGWAPWIVGGRRAGQASVIWLGTDSAPADSDSDWYFHWARVDGGRTTTGTTTKAPLWSGSQTRPEFEAVHLGRDGRMRIGMSVMIKSGQWGVYFQRER